MAKFIHSSVIAAGMICFGSCRGDFGCHLKSVMAALHPFNNIAILGDGTVSADSLPGIWPDGQREGQTTRGRSVKFSYCPGFLSPYIPWGVMLPRILPVGLSPLNVYERASSFLPVIKYPSVNVGQMFQTELSMSRDTFWSKEKDKKWQSMTRGTVGALYLLSVHHVWSRISLCLAK